MSRGRIKRIVKRARRRLAGEEGFTLLELMIVLLVFGVLMTIALPSYLSFKDRANRTAAQQNVAQALRAVVAYGNDNFPGSRSDPNPITTDTGYESLNTAPALTWLATKYDASISTVAGAPFVIDPVGYTLTDPVKQFCLTAYVGRWTAAATQDGTTVGTNFTAGTCVAS